MARTGPPFPCANVMRMKARATPRRGGPTARAERKAAADLDLGKLRTYPIRSRKNKVRVADFARPLPARPSFEEFLEALPRILAGNTLRELVERIAAARGAGKPVVLGMGAHVIKAGLSPLIIQAMRGGWIQAVAMNGAGIIHDYEVATIGETSEEVAASLIDGSFGMVTETLVEMNQAINAGVAKGLGLGEALGYYHNQRKPRPPWLEHSIAAEAERLGLPLTVHVAVGCDTIHMHASASGAAIGEGSLRDFRRLAAVIAELGAGGVFLNVGSAVIIPEVFLKALSVVRNLGFPAHDIVTANLDMIQHYRPSQNVVSRPTGGSRDGTGFFLTGQHELMVPLLFQAVRLRLKA